VPDSRVIGFMAADRFSRHLSNHITS
jgi:hypothetical protein